MSDLIDRQDALELVRDVCNAIMSCCKSHYDEDVEDEVYDDIHEVATIPKCNKEIRIALKNMPSAQPEDKCSECDAWNKYKNYPSTQPEPQWIPCNWHKDTENLPDECESVLICIKDKIGTYVDVSYRTDYNRWERYGRNINVVAWMPLPKSYSGETELRDYENEGDDY